jgi:hypothetical protein
MTKVTFYTHGNLYEKKVFMIMKDSGRSYLIESSYFLSLDRKKDQGKHDRSERFCLANATHLTSKKAFRLQTKDKCSANIEIRHQGLTAEVTVVEQLPQGE